MWTFIEVILESSSDAGNLATEGGINLRPTFTGRPSLGEGEEEIPETPVQETPLQPGAGEEEILETLI